MFYFLTDRVRKIHYVPQRIFARKLNVRLWTQNIRLFFYWHQETLFWALTLERFENANLNFWFEYTTKPQISRIWWNGFSRDNSDIAFTFHSTFNGKLNSLILNRSAMDVDKKYSELFELAVSAIIRYGRASMTMPGFSASLSRKKMHQIVNRSRTKDKLLFLERKLKRYNCIIDRNMKRKRKNAERIASKKVVRVWKLAYEAQAPTFNQKRRIRFIDETSDNLHSAGAATIILCDSTRWLT